MQANSSTTGALVSIVLLAALAGPIYVADAAEASCVGGDDSWVTICTPTLEQSSIGAIKPSLEDGTCIRPIEQLPGVCLVWTELLLTQVGGDDLITFNEDQFSEDVCAIVNLVAPDTCQTGAILGYGDGNFDGVLDGVVFDIDEGPLYVPFNAGMDT